MTKISIISILILISLQSNAQVCNTNFFHNFEPNWSVCIYEEDLIEEQVGVYRNQQILMDGNNIYSIFTIGGWDGFVINKINKVSGDKLWSKYYYQQQDSVRYFPSSISLIENDTLLLYCYAESKTRNSGTVWYDGNMSKWKFNSVNGKLLKFQSTDDLDTNNINMVHSFNIFNPFLFSSHLYRKGLDNRYVEKTLLDRNPQFICHDIDEYGHSIYDTTITFKSKFNRIIFHHDKRISRNRLFSLRYSRSTDNPKDSFQIEFDVLDENFHSKGKKDITYFFNGDSYLRSYVGDSSFCVIQKKRKPFQSDSVNYYSIYSFNFDGDLLDKIELVNYDGSPVKPFRGEINAIILEENTLVLVQTKIDSDAYWEWFLSSGKGKVEHIGKLRLNNSEDKFIWDIFSQINMNLIGDDILLVHALHENNSGSNTTEIKIPYLLSFSLDKLKETVSTDNFSNPELVIYPNPVNQTIHIDNLDGSFEYNIFNMQGKLLLSGNLNSEIGVHDLIQGFYVLKLYSNSKIYTRKFVKM